MGCQAIELMPEIHGTTAVPKAPTHIATLYQRSRQPRDLETKRQDVVNFIPNHLSQSQTAY